MKKIVVLMLITVIAAVVSSTHVDATSLKMQPLLYNDSIQKGEKKKGYVDISNPTGQTIQLQTSVQAFRQTDNNGSLQFYDNEQVSAGIIPDLSNFTIGPREAIRMYFLIDGSKLPEGDVFAAIFVSTKGEQEARGIAEVVRLGTILTIVNGTPGARQASIESLSLAFFQFGQGIEGAYRIKNVADPTVTTGFYPEVVVRLTPFATESTAKSPLVMGGKSRESNFSLKGDRLGFYKLSVGYGKSEQSRWVFVMTGFWQWLAPLIIFIGIFGVIVLKAKRHKKGYFRAK